MHRSLAYSTSLGDSANHSSGSYTRHGMPVSSTLPASSWRLPRVGWSAVLLRSRTLMVMFLTSSAHLDRGCFGHLVCGGTSALDPLVARNRKAADPLSG